MRATIDPKLTAGRIRQGRMASDNLDGMNGAFVVTGPNGAPLVIVANDTTDPSAKGWEHVSVSLKNRCPNWPEMCFVKALFWMPEETVIQYHPPESTYVSNHAFCLHLWRDTRVEVRLPPPLFVGIKEAGELRGSAHAHQVKLEADRRLAASS